MWMKQFSMGTTLEWLGIIIFYYLSDAIVLTYQLNYDKALSNEYIRREKFRVSLEMLL